MTKFVPARPDSRKYAKGETLPHTQEPPAYIRATPENRPMFLAHISKVIGRKQLCFELRISKHQLDMWLSGERKDPIERTRDIMRIAAKCYGADLPLDIAQNLVEEFGGVVLMKRTVKP